MLTNDQKAAYEGIKDFLLDPNKCGFYALEGYAGTGKTYLVCKLLEDIKKDILVTAPTNKALHVLMEGYPQGHFKTLHSAFGLKPKITANGSYIFVAENRSKAVGYDYNIIFVDEMSMVNDDLFDILKEEMEKRSIKILFIGDKCQIPPVGQRYSKPCDDKTRERLGFKVFKLSEIVRQSKDSPIIKSSIEIRNNLEAPTHILGNERLSEKEQIKPLLNKLFNNETFMNNSDYSKVLAWRNKTVDTFNNVIRGLIYGDKAKDRIVIGEKIIADSPIVDEETLLFSTNSEMTVINIVEFQDIINNISIPYYRALVRDVDGDEKFIKILTWQGMLGYKERLVDLRNQTKGLTGKDSSRAWRRYYMFMNSYADIGYNYAITVHKSQGSTYENTLVLEYDIDKNNKMLERNRIKYTAMTRASKKLYII